jgi:hypothetical protein
MESGAETGDPISTSSDFSVHTSILNTLVFPFDLELPLDSLPDFLGTKLTTLSV